MSHLFQSYSQHERNMFVSAYETITCLEAWEFLKEYNPPENTGFMFDTNPEVTRIKNEIVNAYDSHSGSSLASTIRMMQ